MQAVPRKSPLPKSRSYDACLSFAGEDRPYVQKLARLLQVEGVRTFFDEFEQVTLWGRDLYSHLQDVYKSQASYCVVFISKHYAKKAWTNHERQSAQARALRSDKEYILPVRFDDTKIPGILDTIGFIDLRNTSPEELCEMIKKKVGPRPRENFFPPVPDRLFKRLKAKSRKLQEMVDFSAQSFFQALTRTSVEERMFIYDVFMCCCPAELPDNVHINLDLLRRITGLSPGKIGKISSAIRSLGFHCHIRPDHGPNDDEDGEGPVFVLEWQNMSVVQPGNDTWIALVVIECATDNYCEAHARMMFERLDFGQLAASTTTVDHH